MLNVHIPELSLHSCGSWKALVGGFQGGRAASVMGALGV